MTAMGATQPETAAPRTFDWPEAHRRLDAILTKLDAAENQDPAEMQRKLRSRALAYAKPAPRAAEHSEIEVVLFEIGGARFAIEIAYAAAAVSLAGMIAVPGLPSFYLGLVGHRGVVFPVIDLRPLIGPVRGARGDFQSAILIRDRLGMIGLAASGIAGIARLRTDQIAALAEDLGRNRPLAGVAPDNTTIIDTVRLLQDARLQVNEQPSIVARNDGDAR